MMPSESTPSVPAWLPQFAAVVQGDLPKALAVLSQIRARLMESVGGVRLDDEITADTLIATIGPNLQVHGENLAEARAAEAFFDVVAAELVEQRRRYREMAAIEAARAEEAERAETAAKAEAERVARIIKRGEWAAKAEAAKAAEEDRWTAYEASMSDYLAWAQRNGRTPVGPTADAPAEG